MQIDWTLIATIALSVGGSFVALRDKLTQNRDKVQEISTLLEKVTAKVEKSEDKLETLSNQNEELKATVFHFEKRLERLENKLN